MRVGDFLTLAERQYGDRAAVVYEGASLTYAELQHRSRALAQGLLELADPGDRVAILANNCPEYVEAVFGVPTARQMLTFVNPRLAASEILHVLEHSGARVVIVEPPLLGLVSEIRERLPALEHVVVLGGVAPERTVAYETVVAAGEQATADVSGASSDEVAWLIYTSGTTGRPKGAMLTHQNLFASVANTLMSVQPERHATHLMPFPMAHVTAHLCLAWAAKGITLVLQPSFDPESFVRAIEEYGAAGSPIAPVMLSLILQRPELERYDVSSMRKLFYGSSAIAPDLLRRSMARFANADFYQSFGMTELAGTAGWLDPEQHRLGAGGQPGLLSAIGRPAPLAAFRVVDDDLHDVAPGAVGELAIRGDQVTAGYWRDDAATQAAIVDGWLRTGDLATVDADGIYAIVDRKKDMILTGGENVYSREVEDALADLPGLAEVAVIGLPDPVWGENVCAVIVPLRDATITAEGVIAHCRSRLASYKKPKSVHVVPALPRNATGKVLKHRLRQDLSSADRLS
ncbi:Long-chain-fatty-acid--CoA ligase [Paraconexibacter sp. AEG42_29]|uniref:Long-chain-fatty-acid--CoA ligase n=1 Tax=Paraconexibacter sp. AEG42_29 TaxID=2997339 RepID=A0AAU7B0G1_9ACTN